MSIVSHFQLSIKSEQDYYLTSNPEISYFRHSYKKHTNFSMEPISLPINNLNFGKTTSVNITRNGDLINKMYLQLSIIAKNTNYHWGWIKNLGLNLINYIELVIGDTIITKCMDYGYMYGIY